MNTGSGDHERRQPAGRCRFHGQSSTEGSVDPTTSKISVGSRGRKTPQHGRRQVFVSFVRESLPLDEWRQACTCGWLKLDDALFATVISGRPATRYHLIAERLPYTERWDWTVWRPGHSRNGPSATARHRQPPRRCVRPRLRSGILNDSAAPRTRFNQTWLTAIHSLRSPSADLHYP